MKVRAEAILALFSSLACIGSTQAKEQGEVFEMLVHSDVPLWGKDHDAIWPVHFTDDDGSFGCSSRVAFGDWKVEGTEQDPTWNRYENYGVFHCAVVARSADHRQDLEKADWTYGFFVRIGTVRNDPNSDELWVFQSGTVPGSTYTLLRRKPAKDRIERFELLQSKCPQEDVRKGPSLDIFGTTYCAINSKAKMIDFARKMAELPALGTMTRLPEEPGASPPQN